MGKFKIKEKIGLAVSKKEDHPSWYKQLLIKANLLEYSNISGCYILLPNSFFIWESIQNFMNAHFPSLGVSNAYFPMFVPKSALYKEKDHIAGFQPEVAWITHSGNKALKEPIAIRPTSETVMYPVFANLIRSHADLPLKLNQWCNVVRWEFKCPTPFIRSREFLWQEGHCVHSDAENARSEVRDRILPFYERVYKDILAVYTIRGEKTEEEKFPGAENTYTLEAFIEGSGRAVQAATAHYLGTNFAEIFDIGYFDVQAASANSLHSLNIEGKEKEKEKKKKFAFQNCWGLTTRSIGIALMQHSDDKGAVISPRAARIQIVIVPILGKKEERNDLFESSLFLFIKEIYEALVGNKEGERRNGKGFRVLVDERRNFSSGYKFNDWELKGVPMRLEVGPKDLKRRGVMVSMRNSSEKFPLSFDSSLDSGCQVGCQPGCKVGCQAGCQKIKFLEEIKNALDKMHNELYEESKALTLRNIKSGKNWKDFMEIIKEKKIAKMHSCNEKECEIEICRRSGEEANKKEEKDKKNESEREKGEEEENKLSGCAKSLCIPEESEFEGLKCFGCGKESKKVILYGKTY